MEAAGPARGSQPGSGSRLLRQIRDQFEVRLVDDTDLKVPVGDVGEAMARLEHH